ncbi:MAG: hypothetical protein K6F94_00865 [Bacteroidaceae bacterium]|nr:hypothetical protein [Bacteroidaceae bacterium]
MKKSLLTLCALLMAVSGAWADATTKSFTVTFGHTSSYGIVYTSSGSATTNNWGVKWVSGGNSSTQLPNVTITSNGNTISGINGYFLNGSYTISVPEGLTITGYTMQAMSYEEGVSDTEKYITPAGGSATELNTSTDKEVAVTGLSSNTTSFTITGTNDGRSRVIFSSFTINVQATVLSSLEDASSENTYYLVCRRGFTTIANATNVGNVVKSTSYSPEVFKIVSENESYYLKTADGLYVTQTGAISSTANGVLTTGATEVTDFPLMPKIGEKVMNAGTGGTYGIVWNTESSQDAGNCYAIIQGPSTSTLNYSLTDANGATYTGSFTGVTGQSIPVFSGCYGYTLSNGSWDGNTYSATITFPFKISSNSVNNYTYIGSFHNKNLYSSENFLWHASSPNVICHSGDAPTNANSNGAYTENLLYEWAIIPVISDLNITFTIKNASTGTSIYSNSSKNSTAITLESTGTAWTYETGSTTNCGTIYYWKRSTDNFYLSVNGVGGGTDQKLAVHSSVHDGISIGFYNPADFASLMSYLSSYYNAGLNYKNYYVGTGLGKYTDTDNALSTAITNAASVATGESNATASVIEGYTTALENAINGLVINQPATGSFLKFKGGNSGNYVLYGDKVESRYPMGADATAAIFYYDGSHVLSYSSGIYWGVTGGSGTTNWGWTSVGGTGSTITFLGSNDIGKYFINLEKNTSSYTYNLLYDASTRCDRSGYNDVSSVTTNNLNWTLEEVTSLPVTISTAQYATFWAPVAVTIPSGVKAYYISELSDTEATLAEISTTIPAETPVVLKATSTLEEATTFNFAITTSDAFAGTNKLAGQAATIAFADGSYTLQKRSGGSDIGFFPTTTTGSTLAGFKAYLPSSAFEAGVKGFTFKFDTETIVKAIEAAENPNKVVYDLSGRRVQNPAKGIFIVDGKKIVIK